jgi:(1->4)-alpha-D-glucan 1-alpha-D-glucosylmutase
VTAPLRATYRLQLTASFGFDHARAVVPYLTSLGVSHLYLSPSLQARSGSTHGYDVIDPRRISPELGGEAAFRSLSEAARRAGMGIVLDIVPNHMAAVADNPFWADESLRERFFDIDPTTGRHRRFFDIDDLAGVRQEDPAVFEETHALVLSLVHEGVVDGLRIDHPDGLAEPASYLQRLRDRDVERVWVEKILDPGERLRDWPVSGTTGYEFLNDVCAVSIDPAGEAALTALWEQISGDSRAFDEIAHEAKLEQVGGPFAPERDRLLRVDPGVGRSDLEAALSSLPVYRTYIDPHAGAVDDQDRDAVVGLPESVRERLLLSLPSPDEFVTRFQQTTPAIMAKGVEDTAFYRYGRLLALNDVGGDPSRFGIDVATFHASNLERLERFPLSMVTTMTHDTKRSGDVRARIAAITTISSEWADAVWRWMELTEPFRTDGAPDDAERYFIFQTLAGAWPIEPERVANYMRKALREAKRNTSWISPNTDWEDAVVRFCRALPSDAGFLTEFSPIVARLGELGRRAALGQLALKLTVPGVPDVYQGDELWNRALVDPDNRRPVDFDRGAELLRARDFGSEPKLWLTSELLALRARRPESFAGAYDPVDAGEGAVAFIRGGDVLVAVELRPGLEALSPPQGEWDVVVRDDVHRVTVLERAGR